MAEESCKFEDALSFLERAKKVCRDVSLFVQLLALDFDPALPFADITIGLLKSEFIPLWSCRVQHLRPYPCNGKVKQRDRGVISCHVWYLPVVMLLWLTTLFYISLFGIYLQDSLGTFFVVSNALFVLSLLLPVVRFWWCIAVVHSEEQSIPQRYNSKHRYDGCHILGNGGVAILKGIVLKTPATLVCQLLKCCVASVFQYTYGCEAWCDLIPLLLLLCGDVETNPGPAYDDYVSVLPLTSREYLDKVLDWDNRGVNKDLDKIAHVMIDWEEKLSSGLEIPYVDIQNLKTEYANKDILLRRAILRKWKELKGSNATYGNLLRICCKEHLASVAEVICDVLKSRITQNTGGLNGSEEASSTSKPFYCQGEDISSLPPHVFVDLKQQLESNLEEILFCFAAYTDCVQVSLEKKRIEVKRLCAYLLGLPSFMFHCNDRRLVLLATKKTELEEADSIGDIMVTLKTECTSFLNYQIYQGLVKHFDLDNGQNDLKYPEKLRAYIEMHKISEFIEIQPILCELTEEKKELILILDIEPTCRLSGLVDLGKAVAKIMGLKQSALLIHNIKENCVIVTYLISAFVADSIFTGNKIFSEKQEEEFRELSVQRMECNLFVFEFTSASDKDLNHEMDEIDIGNPALIALREDAKKLENFVQIANETFSVMEQSNVCIGDVRAYLSDLSGQIKNQHFYWPEIAGATKATEAWSEISVYFDFLNYNLLEHLVNRFGNDVLVTSLQDYKRDLEVFRTDTRLCDFANLFLQYPPQSNQKEIVIALLKDWQEYTLEDLVNWKETFAQEFSLPSYFITLQGIDSIMCNARITWGISSSFMVSIKEKMESVDLEDFCKQHGLLLMSVDSEEYGPQSQTATGVMDPIMLAAMQTTPIIPEVFDWCRDTGFPVPSTITKLYAAFTCKLLMQHCKVDGDKPLRIKSLEGLPSDVKWMLHNLCEVAWQGTVRQQLSFSINDVGRDTLGLMRELRTEGGQLSYHFIYLPLQEFLSAYYIAQLPLDKQKEFILKHLAMKNLDMVIRFYFGLTGPNEFSLKLVAERVSLDEKAVIHWLFELGDTRTVTKELESRNIRTVDVELSYSWISLDYCVLSYCMCYYPIQWRLYFESNITGDEQMELLYKGVASTSKNWKGEILGQFSDCSFTQEGMKWFVSIQLPFLRKIKELDFSFNKLNADALDIFCEVIPKLKKLEVLCLNDNSIGKGGAVTVLQHLKCDESLLTELNLRNTGVGEEDCTQLALLMSNTNMEVLDVSDNSLSSSSVDSIISGLLQNSTLQALKMSNTLLSDDNCIRLSSFLQRKVCRVKWLDLCNSSISSRGASYLALSLTYNYSLTTLEISDNPIGDVGATAFGLALKTNSVLTQLCVDCCEITSNGTAQIAEGLCENIKLKVLQANGNHFGVEGAKSMSEMIQRNRTLQHLYLHDDDTLAMDGIELLVSSLKKNRTLLRLDLPKQYKHDQQDKQRVVWL